MTGNEFQAQIEELKSQLQIKEEQLNALTTEINSIYNSRSWRISKPLRWAGKIARKIVPKKMKTAIRIFRQSGIKGVLATVYKKSHHGISYPSYLKTYKNPIIVNKEVKTAFSRRQLNAKFIEKAKTAIDKCEIVSFDVFDTLLCRLVEKPTDVFRIMEHQLGIAGFSEFRNEMQFKASILAENEKNVPHADLDDIYDYIAQHSNLHCNWNLVKELELQIEDKLLVANCEIKEVYDYAVKAGKRIIAVSDMYLHEDFLEEKLKKEGYVNIAKVYVSSDCHVAKFRGTMFPYVIQQEGSTPKKLVHIGDNPKDDYDLVKNIGINAILYKTRPRKKTQNIADSLHDGIVNCCSKESENFWFFLGANIGGRIYRYLNNWFLKSVKDENKGKKIFFLSRDGYNLYSICKESLGGFEVSYLYTSRRALLLASINCLSEDELCNLPPFTFGQTVYEILSYLKMNFITLIDIKKVGFHSFSDKILSETDFEKFRRIYLLKKDSFLSLCREERENARKYFTHIGLLDSDCIVFDCGWNGSSQYLLGKVLSIIGYSHTIKFLYAGIFDNEKSKRQLQNCIYETCFFGINRNLDLANQVKDSIALFELFFGAPHNSVLRYIDTNDGIEFEKLDESSDYKNNILHGIKAYLHYASLIESFNIFDNEYSALSSLIRLMQKPTEKEACIIGNVENVDGFAAKKGEKKYLAKVTNNQIKKDNYNDFYWVQGLLCRPDIKKSVKKYVFSHYHVDNYKENFDVENQFSDDEYQKWIKKNETNIYEIHDLKFRPLISIVVPVYNVLSSELVACIESVIKQTYDNWELCMVDDASSWENVRIVLKNYADNPKIHIAYHAENQHISKTTNDAIAMAKGEYIAFLDCDDVLAPNAIFEMTKKVNENSDYDFIYSDEDKLTENGKIRRNPFFKPDWSPDTFMSLMYTCHFSMYRRSLVNEIGGLTLGLEGAQDYDFTLRFTEKTNKIGHISKVLYHWRERPQSIASNPEAKPYALLAIKKLKEKALERRGLVGEIIYCKDVFQFRTRYIDVSSPLTSIIIPSKDNFDVFRRCILSLRQTTKYKNYEVIVVDNGSSVKNRALYEEASEKFGFSYIYEPMPFNFSKMCNIGAKNSNGDVLVFLNNDTEIISADWLDIMVGHTGVPWSGAVGAKLYYPGGERIQHVGVINLDIGPSHAFIGFSDAVPYYYCLNRLDYNFSAVTGACLAIRKEKFYMIGGFDEHLPIAYNDVDFCFSLVERGLFNVIRNDVVLIHHESLSRGLDDIDRKKQMHLEKEREYLYTKHPSFFHSDPFYNHNLTQNRCDYKINLD